MKKGLRDSEPMPASSTPRGPNGLTQPKPFRLSVGTPSSRARPKSSAQLEEEMMEYHRAHPFKAREIGEGVDQVPARSSSTSRPRPPTAPRSRMTTPKPFRLSHSNHLQASPMATVDMEARECEKQFKARPLPGGRPAHSRLSMPTHASVHGSIAYQTPEPQRKPVNVKSIRPPRLVSELRVERREEVKVRSERNAKEILDEKKRRDRLRRQEEADANISSTPFARGHLTEPEPFNLESVQRHEVCQMELEQKRKEALGPSPPKRVITKTPGEITQPRPFQLESDFRGERARQELQDKIDREEAEQEEERKFRARPITRFKNNTSQHRPPPKPLVQPFSPELSMKRRSQQRKEYDEAAELRREEDMLNKRMAEEQKEAELDAEIEELRRLPVEEGGMQFRAGEINEVWEGRRF